MNLPRANKTIDKWLKFDKGQIFIQIGDGFRVIYFSDLLTLGIDETTEKKYFLDVFNESWKPAEIENVIKFLEENNMNTDPLRE